MNSFIENVWNKLLEKAEFYTPKVGGAFLILFLGVLLGYLTYKFTLYIFKRFNIVEIIDKLNLEFSDEIAEEEKQRLKKSSKKIEKEDEEEDLLIKKLSQKVKIDKIVAKSASYYVFLLCFRQAIIFIGIKEIESFLSDLIAYLPSLFIGFLIGFFGIRFANFIYDVIYHTLDLSGEKTSKLIATGGKGIILFFTIMAVLDRIGIPGNITYIILTGFIAMLSIAGGLAFGLGGKDLAKEILISFKK